MKKIIFALATLAISAPSFAGTLTVYGSESTSTTTTTTKPDHTTTTTTSIKCGGDMTKVCYTRDTGGGSLTPRLGSQIAISVYKDGQISEVHKGVLESFNESPQTGVYTILQAQR